MNKVGSLAIAAIAVLPVAAHADVFPAVACPSGSINDLIWNLGSGVDGRFAYPTLDSGAISCSLNTVNDYKFRIDFGTPLAYPAPPNKVNDEPLSIDVSSVSVSSFYDTSSHPVTEFDILFSGTSLTYKVHTPDLFIGVAVYGDVTNYKFAPSVTVSSGDLIFSTASPNPVDVEVLSAPLTHGNAPVSAPEPSSALLLVAGFAGAIGTLRRKIF